MTDNRESQPGRAPIEIDRSEEAMREGYEQALSLVRRCATEHGFVASPTEHHNYRRIWGRDAPILGLAGIACGEEPLIDCLRRSLVTLADNQGPHGEIPSNVDPETGRVSYGGTAGRVDAGLWFLVGCAEYWLSSGDDDFLERMQPVVEKTRQLLGAWEFNNRGLLYVPETGDWADEYIHDGYVLYDQLLYLQAQRGVFLMHRALHGGEDHALHDRIVRLKHLIRANYWFVDGDDLPDHVYHRVLYDKGRRTPGCRHGRHWMPFFSPLGYGYRYDALANVLASLLEVSDDERTRRSEEYLREKVLHPGLALLPAFHPVVMPKDEDWEELQMSFSHSFKNKPYEYQNGGLWPMITGFHVADLARRGEREAAREALAAIHWANRLSREGEDWGFSEFVDGHDFRPGGTRHQGWSAGAAVLGHHALEEGHCPFRACIEQGCF